jgi:hypothetical protein
MNTCILALHDAPATNVSLYISGMSSVRYSHTQRKVNLTMLWQKNSKCYYFVCNISKMKQWRFTISHKN